jgi:predicted CXXCH cytochrome family protein
LEGGRSKGVLDAQCDRCHRFARGLSHPVSVPAPAGMTKLPLESGRVVCITCHDDRTLEPHGTTGPRYSVNSSSDPMLRTDSVDSLCSTCHEGGLRGSSVHATGLMRAHLEGSDLSRPAGSSQSGRRSGARAALSSERFDAETAACLNCHDGSVASDVGNHVDSMHRSGSGGMGGMDGPSSHPIGVLYKATSSRDAIELRAPGSLDQRIRLFDQRVGCGSCHSIYSGHQKELVFPNDRSALCLSCHRM